MAKVTLSYPNWNDADVQSISLEYPVIDEDEYTVVVRETLGAGPLLAGVLGLVGALSLMLVAWLTRLGSPLFGGVTGALLGTVGVLVPGIVGWLPLDTAWVVGGAIAGLFAGVVVSMLAALVRYSPRRVQGTRSPTAMAAT